METLNLIFGLVTVISFGFAIYSHYKGESRKEIEAARTAILKEKTKNTHSSIIALLHTIDGIVQIPKKGNTTVEQMQDLARIARGQAKNLEEQFDQEYKKLNNWRYGVLVNSNDPIIAPQE